MHFINRRCSRLCTISVSTALCPSNCSLRTIRRPLSVVFCNHRRILFTEFFSHTLKFGDVPAWSESFRMKFPMFAWWQRISWNTLRTGLSPELISARNPLWQLWPPQPNFIFQEPFLRTLLDAVEKLQIKTAEKTASDAVVQQNTPQNEQFANQMMLQLLPKLIENPDSFSKLIKLADKAKK